MFVYFFGNQLISTFDPKNAFLSGFHSKNRRIIEYAYEYKIDEDDFKGNKEDYEGREQWDERAEIEELIDINYGIYNYKLQEIWLK